MSRVIEFVIAFEDSANICLGNGHNQTFRPPQRRSNSVSSHCLHREVWPIHQITVDSPDINEIITRMPPVCPRDVRLSSHPGHLSHIPPNYNPSAITLCIRTRDPRGQTSVRDSFQFQIKNVKKILKIKHIGITHANRAWSVFVIASERFRKPRALTNLGSIGRKLRTEGGSTINEWQLLTRTFI